MPEMTENYIRVPVRNSKEYARIRTIMISRKEVIKALVGVKEGKKGTEVVTYLFDKKWTMKKAKDWVAAHAEKGKARPARRTRTRKAA